MSLYIVLRLRKFFYTRLDVLHLQGLASLHWVNVCGSWCGCQQHYGKVNPKSTSRGPHCAPGSQVPKFLAHLVL